MISRMFFKTGGWLATFVSLSFSQLSLGALPVFANADLDDGIRKHNAGHYSEALAAFGAAESAEFNNPVLHYYMADSYNRLRQTSDAIREYRVARSLQPKGQLASYCESALKALGCDPNPAAAAAAKSAPAIGITAPAQDGRLAAIETERKQKLDELQKGAERDIADVNKKVQIDKEDVRRSIAQTIQSYHGGAYQANPEFQSAMEQIDLNAVNKTNEINTRLRQKMDEANAWFDQRVQATGSTGGGSSSVRSTSPSSTSSPSSFVNFAGNASAETSRAQSKGSASTALSHGSTLATIAASNMSKLASAVPSEHTAVGLLPLVSQPRPRGSNIETLYARIDSDGSWETNNAEKSKWREELFELPDMKNQWQDWQRRVAQSMFTVVNNLDRHQVTGGVCFRLTISRTGDIVEAIPYNGNVSPDGCSKEYTKDFLESPAFIAAKHEGVPALPSTTHFSRAYVVVFLTEKNDAWWTKF